MSSDEAPGAPSFGDLFDDPDAPLPSVATPAPAPTPTDDSDDDSADDSADVPSAADEPAADVAFSSPYTEATSAAGRAADEPLLEESAAASYAAPAASPASPGPPVAPVAPEAPVAVAAAGSRSPGPAPWDGHVDPAVSSAPATRVDTGRLYRSAGAEGPATLDAIPAIDPSYVPRTTAVADAAAANAVKPDAGTSGGRGLTYSGTAVVVIGVTVLVAFADALINDKLGIMTGVALAASSIYAAISVRRADIWAAVVMPPLAFLVAALTAGQLTLDSSGSLILREAYMLFRTLAVNAPWILGTTVVCLVIVLVRRARS